VEDFLNRKSWDQRLLACNTVRPMTSSFS
jgi:hypothetical protein